MARLPFVPPVVSEAAAVSQDASAGRLRWLPLRVGFVKLGQPLLAVGGLTGAVGHLAELHRALGGPEAPSCRSRTKHLNQPHPVGGHYAAPAPRVKTKSGPAFRGGTAAKGNGWQRYQEAPIRPKKGLDRTPNPGDNKFTQLKKG